MEFICNSVKMSEISTIITKVSKVKHTVEEAFTRILMDFCYLYYKDNKTDIDYDSLSIAMAILMYCDFDYNEEKKKR